MIKLFFKIIFFILGCIIIVIMAIASNSQWLDDSAPYIPSPYRYGDLYLLSSMPNYRIKIDQKIKKPASTKNKNTTLTIIGDSYTDKFDSTNFSSGAYSFIHWDKTPDTIPVLDQTKKNIVIIESTERYIRWRFTKNNLLSIGSKAKSHNDEAIIELSAETTLQYMLTHLDLELPFKELKASIYLKCFNKYSDMVSKPDNSGRLYLTETIDPKNNFSSFCPIDNSEISSMVNNLNKINSELLALGFDEVYISIIPNAASIYKKSNYPYNHLIERIQQHPDVKFKFIDVYKIFKQEKQSVFYHNDSHWNTLGKMIWLRKINRLFEMINKFDRN